MNSARRFASMNSARRFASMNSARRFASWACVAAELVEQLKELAEAGSPATFAALRAGPSTWAETLEDYARIYPH